jgi:hypothetical protein
MTTKNKSEGNDFILVGHVDSTGLNMMLARFESDSNDGENDPTSYKAYYIVLN